MMKILSLQGLPTDRGAIGGENVLNSSDSNNCSSYSTSGCTRVD